MSASIVIGQSEFTSRAPGLARNKIRQPDGISYDPVNERLHLTDKGNERVLVFDARPSVLESYPEAIGVVGEIDFDDVRMGPGDPRNHQDRLFDPRGNAFDAEQQRLFQTEGLNTRITVFTYPREDFDITLPPRSTLQYDSLDARPASGAGSLQMSQAVVELDEAVPALGITSHLVTRPVIDEPSERESRLLLSEASLPARAPTRELQVFYDEGLKLTLANPGAGTARVELQVGDAVETLELGAGAQSVVDAGALFGGARSSVANIEQARSHRRAPRDRRRRARAHTNVLRAEAYHR